MVRFGEYEWKVGEWDDEKLLASLSSASFGWRLIVWGGNSCGLPAGPPERGRELGDSSDDESAPPAPAVRAVLVSIAGVTQEVTPIVAPSALLHTSEFEPWL